MGGFPIFCFFFFDELCVTAEGGQQSPCKPENLVAVKDRGPLCMDSYGN